MAFYTAHFIPGSGSVTIENATGTIGGGNVTFTVAHTPKFVLCDGGIYIEDFGYTLSGGVISMAFEPTSYVKYSY